MSIPAIDFERIREHNGSRDRAFEELCCQLAYLDEGSSDGTFFRKGAGADAGVECFASFKDGPETGWQVKYYWKFDTGLEKSLNESIKTALKKHPCLNRYIVCIPFNLSDARTGRSKTPLARWTDWRTKWIKQAAKDGKGLEIELWSASTLTDRLLAGNGQHQGRLRYWFDISLLTPAWFENRFELTNADLGDRYTVQTNIELSLKDVFLGLAQTPEAMSRIEEALDVLATSGRKALVAVSRAGIDATQSEIVGLAEAIERLPQECGTYAISVARGPVAVCLDKLDGLLSGWEEVREALFRSFPDAIMPREFSDFRSRIVSKIAEFKGSRWSLVDRDCALLVGEGGAGKSHLLADVVACLLSERRPAVMLLGQYFVAGNLWPQVMSLLGLPADWTGTDLLGALDAAAQASDVRALVVIDAINEHGGVDIWSARLAGFLKEFDRFPNVAVVLSCRSTYVEFVVPHSLAEDTLPRLEHVGFGAADAKAYLLARGLLLASIPKPVHELQNPLFLKTCCDYLLRNGTREFPQDLIGASKVFRFYLEAVCDSINRRLKLEPRRKTVEKAVESFAAELATSGSEEVNISRVHELFDALMPANMERDKDILTQLESEGLLSVDIAAEETGQKQEVVRFTFQRLSDYMVASHLLARCNSTDLAKQAFAQQEGLGRYLSYPLAYHRAGVVEALALLTVENLGAELPDLVDEGEWWGLEDAFRASLVWRAQSLFTERTLELVDSILGKDEVFPVLISVATEPGNRYNADHTHSKLVGLTMPHRDRSWSIPLAQAAYERDSAAWVLIDWAWVWGSDPMHEERAALAATELTWFLTASFRALRDRATKALVALFATRASLAISTFDKFWTTVDDDYLRERLLAAIYGAVLQGTFEDADLSQLVTTLYCALYEADALPVNCLIRDHAQGIVEYCRQRGCLPGRVDPAIVSSPHSSSWPLEFVPDETIDTYTEAYKGGRGRDRIVSSAVSDGDFARYVIDRHSAQWSPALIGVEALPTHFDLAQRWCEDLLNCASGDIVDALSNLLDAAEAVRGQNSWAKTPERETLAAAESKLRSLISRDVWEDYRVRAQSWMLSGARKDKTTIARFDRAWARRWVCKRAHDLGWAEDLHGEFDGSRMIVTDRMTHTVERIGKKYQWLALFELRARLADHCSYINSGGLHEERSSYGGEMSDGARDIDPSLLLKRSSQDNRSYSGPACWWSPIAPNVNAKEPDELVHWLYGDGDFINSSFCIDVTGLDNKNWLVLRTFRMGQPQSKDDSALRGDTWARISSFVVPKAGLNHKLKRLKGMLLQDPDSIPVQRIGARGHYLGEYPWRSHLTTDDGVIEEADQLSRLPFSFKPTVVSYLCEHGNNDYSIDDSIDVELPAPWLIDALGLRSAGGRTITYVDQALVSRFFDPAVNEAGPQAALVDRELFLEAMRMAELVPIWVIAGEKNVFGSRNGRDGFGGRRNFTSVYWLEEEQWKHMDHDDIQHPSESQAKSLFNGDVPPWVKTR